MVVRYGRRRSGASAWYSLCFFFFYCYGDHRDLHSFPTRRSSDLSCTGWVPSADSPSIVVIGVPIARLRSEEHTSALQSRGHLVCRLLLELKKQRAAPSGARPQGRGQCVLVRLMWC